MRNDSYYYYNTSETAAFLSEPTHFVLNLKPKG